MLNKHLFFLLAISTQTFAMERECTIQMSIDGTEVIKRKVCTLLKTDDETTQNIVKDLLLQDHPKKRSPEQEKKRTEILRKINESDE